MDSLGWALEELNFVLIEFDTISHLLSFSCVSDMDFMLSNFLLVLIAKNMYMTCRVNGLWTMDWKLEGLNYIPYSSSVPYAIFVCRLAP